MPKARHTRRGGMRLVSWNVNGLRAAIRKGIDGWIETIGADVLMLQEKLLENHLPLLKKYCTHTFGMVTLIKLLLEQKTM